MFKIFFGLFLIVVSVMLSFIPPFIFGLPVAFLAFGMIMAGLGRTTGQIIKIGLSAAKNLKDRPHDDGEIAKKKPKTEDTNVMTAANYPSVRHWRSI